MTTIVAVETSDGVIVGCDSQVSAGHQKDSLENSKVFYCGEYLIGGAGRLRFIQALQHSDIPPVLTDDLDWHVSEVFASHLADVADKCGVKSHESTVLVVLRGRVYDVSGDGTYVRTRSGLYAVGSGAAYALGSLRTVLGTPTKKDVERALQVAASYDSGTSGPFKIFTV